MPSPLVEDVANHGAGDAVLTGQRGMARVIGLGAYLKNVLFVKCPSFVAALANHVVGIVPMSSQEEVIWANATAGIALVADQHTVWDVSEVKHPGEAMCILEDVLVNSKSPIAAPNLCGRPEPAIACLTDLGPEPTFWSLAWPSHSIASKTTVLTTTGFDSMRLHYEHDTATAASATYRFPLGWHETHSTNGISLS